MTLELAIVVGSSVLSFGLIAAARIRAAGAIAAARATTPVFAAQGGGTIIVNVTDPNAKIGGAS